MLKDPSEIDLLSRIAWLYYKQNMTQSQIAKKFGISSRISRWALTKVTLGLWAVVFTGDIEDGDDDDEIG